MAGDRGYLDTDVLTAGDIRRAWSHMREVCGLVATSACRDELIQQAIRQAMAREAGETVPPPARPNRAALFAGKAASTSAPRQATGEVGRSDEITQAARNIVSAWLREDNRELTADDVLFGVLDGEDVVRIVAYLIGKCVNGEQK